MSQDVDCYEVILNGDDEGEWIHMAEEVDWMNAPSYLEPVQEHEFSRMESEALNNGVLDETYFHEQYHTGDSQ